MRVISVSHHYNPESGADIPLLRTSYNYFSFKYDRDSGILYYQQHQNYNDSISFNSVDLSWTESPSLSDHDLVIYRTSTL